MEYHHGEGHPRPPRSWYSPVVDWIARNKIISLFTVTFLVLAIDLLTLPYGEIEKLRTTNPKVTAFMQEHAERAKRLGKRFTIKQQWVSLREVSTDALNAIVVSEDGSFWSHDGFDWYELKESLLRNLAEGRPARGASTITQQLVKNLFLTSSKNPIRKIREWVLTWKMEKTLSKARILELYINVIEWGEAIYGIEAASQFYFGKSAAELTREEAARLAAVIPSPRRRRPDSGSRYVERRAELILARMAARGM
ncbi:MAG TPA: monofunctional biosynthetic peptidoglycan transglycosylase [Bacteroidota bacterium]|nr:monofunctional biosynthetic peptidoglycan transglycosylase [Bacteroidota bacterium]